MNLLGIHNERKNLLQAEVLVNTVAENLNLEMGVVSSAILKAAGAQIQKEARQQHPKSLTTGEFVTTSAGNLQHAQGVNNILHTSLRYCHAADKDILFQASALFLFLFLFIVIALLYSLFTYINLSSLISLITEL